MGQLRGCHLHFDQPHDAPSTMASIESSQIGHWQTVPWRARSGSRCPNCPSLAGRPLETCCLVTHVIFDFSFFWDRPTGVVDDRVAPTGTSTSNGGTWNVPNPPSPLATKDSFGSKGGSERQVMRRLSLATSRLKRIAESRGEFPGAPPTNPPLICSNPSYPATQFLLCYQQVAAPGDFIIERLKRGPSL